MKSRGVRSREGFHGQNLLSVTDENYLLIVPYDGLKHDRLLPLPHLNTGIKNQGCASSLYMQDPTSHDSTMHDSRITQTCSFYIEIIHDIKGDKKMSVDIQRPGF